MTVLKNGVNRMDEEGYTIYTKDLDLVGRTSILGELLVRDFLPLPSILLGPKDYPLN